MASKTSESQPFFIFSLILGVLLFTAICIFSKSVSISFSTPKSAPAITSFLVPPNNLCSGVLVILLSKFHQAISKPALAKGLPL